jgi:hypothetical protein
LFKSAVENVVIVPAVRHEFAHEKPENGVGEFAQDRQGDLADGIAGDTYQLDVGSKGIVLSVNEVREFVHGLHEIPVGVGMVVTCVPLLRGIMGR